MKNLEKWISDYIVELNLCPFAHNTLHKNKWKLISIDFQKASQIEEVFYAFLNENLEEKETYFLESDQLRKWDDFLFYFHFLEDLTQQITHFKKVKIVGFHPSYVHGEIEEDYLHYSNRSPWPLIQLLHVDDVEKRTKFISVEEVLDKNAETLKNIPLMDLNDRLNDCK